MGQFRSLSNRKISRRAVLAGSAGLVAAYAIGRKLGNPQPPSVPVAIHGAPVAAGHRLREGKFPEPTETESANVVIVGGGVAGLSAAWRLNKKGISDILLLELDSEVGGNARYGSNGVTEYPWGAHYLPLPNDECTSIRELLTDAGVIEGFNDNGAPIYGELHLCAAPRERLFFRGGWQDGLVPNSALTQRDREDIARFTTKTNEIKFAIGNDGRPAFTIPAALSSVDPAYTKYAAISFRDLLDSWQIRSPFFNWYLDYCCRDDYGVDSSRLSAWAGLHYFCSRRPHAANADEDNVLTWPEGNGFLIKILKNSVKDKIRTHALVYRLEENSGGVVIYLFDTERNTSKRIVAKQVILAIPQFIAQRLVPLYQSSLPEKIDYAPWLVANVSIGKSANPSHESYAWDNVFYGTRSLGYVLATHQSLRRFTGETVLTYYLPLDEQPPSASRESAIGTSPEVWRDRVLSELLTYHPELRSRIERVDLWLWGHAMAIPAVGLVPVERARKSPVISPRILIAHSDQSGFSIFEEAHYHGIIAADALMQRI